MPLIRLYTKRLLYGTLKHCCLTYSRRRLCTKEYSGKLMSQLQAKIKFSGPITVADYMKEALTHATEGYYIHRDVFGQKGDFTTSPEISQMFGELVAIWFVNEWMMAGSPDNVQLVELGPGRGTMADDMLRAISNFPELKTSLSLHLIEISEKLSEMQEEKLSDSTNNSASKSSTDNQPHYKSCISKHGPSVYWYHDIQHVPTGYTMFVAHEFFDALPVHKFQKTEKGWREILVDIDPEGDNQLRFVKSPASTAASQVYLKVEPDDSREHIEVCPSAGVTVQYLAKRIEKHGGCALIVDYGHNGTKEDTFRGFKNHQLHDVLVDPGSADLTADVDFAYLRKQAGDKVKSFGPVTQSHFLQNMGIAYRLKILFEKADEQGKKDLLSAFKLLTSPEEMGERFKFLALLNKNCTHNPVGFDPLPEGFKNHQLHDVLVDPGSADLTADVDFAYLRKQAGDKVKSFGPVTQSHFLQNMGIAYRLKILFEKADEQGKKDLLSAFKLLTSPEEMGERFKFLALLNKNCTHNPVGFDPLPEEKS